MKLIALNFVPKKGNPENDVVCGVNIYSDVCGNPNDEDTVYMSSGAYVSIFRKARTKVCRCRQRLSVVKIKNPENGATIYRKYVFSPRFSGVGDNHIVLHPASIRELAAGGENAKVVGKDMFVRTGSFFAYYWNHPFHSTRISMKLGILSLVVGGLSVCLTLLFQFVWC